MKRHSIAATGLLALVVYCRPDTGAQESPREAEQQQPEATDGRDAASRPTRIGLIDMAHVFKHYRKFEVLNEELRAEAEDDEAQARRMAARLQTLQEELKKLKQGSDEQVAVQNEFDKLRTEFESFRRTAQREMLKRQSQVYKTIYLEVSDVVEKLAEERQYTLVLRFTRDPPGEGGDPQEILQGLNRQVIFFNPDDDLTDPVVEQLNENYEAENR